MQGKQKHLGRFATAALAASAYNEAALSFFENQAKLNVIVSDPIESLVAQKPRDEHSATYSLAEGRSTRTNPDLSFQTGDEASHLRESL